MTTKPSGRTVRVASFNVHYGADTAAIAKVFTANENLSQADIILLQEVEEHQAEAISRAEAIARHLGFYFTYAPARPVKKFGTHGLATLSRFPLRDNEAVKLPLHKVGMRLQQRIALISSVSAYGTPVTVCNIHLDTRLNPKERITQLDYALDQIKKRGTSGVVLGGDFNTIPLYSLARTVPIFYANQLKKLHAHLLKQNFANVYDPRGYTLQRGFIRWRLDHIYASGLPIVRCQVEHAVFVSDHKPIWADISIEHN